MRLRVRSLPLLSGLTIGVAMSCGVGCRLDLDPVLLWFWCRLVATAPIRPLAWEPPYAESTALKRQKDKKKKKVYLDCGPGEIGGVFCQGLGGFKG